MTCCNKSKPVLDIKKPLLEDKCFYDGSNMQRNWIEECRSLLDYVSRKYGQSAKASLVAGVLTVT